MTTAGHKGEYFRFGFKRLQSYQRVLSVGVPYSVLLSVMLQGK